MHQNPGSRPPGFFFVRGRRYSQRNVARGEADARRRAQTASSASEPDDVRCRRRRAPSAIRSSSASGAAGSARRDRGERPGQVVDRDDDPAEDEEREEQDVREREHRLGPERARRAAARGRRTRPSRAGPRRRRGAARRRRPAVQPRTQRRDRDEQRDLDGLDDEDGRDQSRDDQLGPAERRPAEPLQDAVRAVVGGRDPEADEARRDDPRARSSPGSRKSTGRPCPSAGSRPTRRRRGRAIGMTIVANRFSPRRSASRSSIAVIAAIARQAGARGHVAASGDRASARRDRRAADQLEVALLERRRRPSAARRSARRARRTRRRARRRAPASAPRPSTR